MIVAMVSRSPGLLASTALVLALCGCGGAPATPSRPAGAPGVTRPSEIFGPRCDDVPRSGPGSAEVMATQPAGTAIGTTPLLTRMGIQLRLSGLDETLDKTDTGYTVFAPAGEAFKPLSHLGDVSRLPMNPKDALRALLSYHVVPKRYTARDLASAGTLTTLQGAPLTVSGDGLDLSIGAQHAHVLCGNIPTLNATVFVIDQVLIPPLSAIPLTPPS
jgi:uncharacterized surface protein with fasciclin (FAS1) repeats